MKKTYFIRVFENRVFLKNDLKMGVFSNQIERKKMKLYAVSNQVNGDVSPKFANTQELGEFLSDGADIDFELTSPTFEELATWMISVCSTWELRISAE